MRKRPNKPVAKDYVVELGNSQMLIKMDDMSIFSPEENLQEAATLAVEKLLSKKDQPLSLHPFTIVYEKGDEKDPKKKVVFNTCRLLANCGSHFLSQRLREIIRMDHPKIDKDYDSIK